MLIETKHDIYIIESQTVEKPYEDKWKAYGALMVGSEILALSSLFVTIIGVAHAIALLFVSLLWYWVTHDIGMGLRLKKDPLYLGTRGFDKRVREIFQNNKYIYFGQKAVWLGLAIATYFSL